MESKTRNVLTFLRNTVLYFVILLGFIFLYLVDINVMMNADKDLKPQSKIEFIYQQF